ncbi:energy transducer TonB [Halomonas nitroreducens]|uniref:Protein TonB n=1 Tax=Halomonas nitroreducens TaxID=447425 RepID=A0A431V670_9GAMM|nr:energy transducer TonB [Halomonas nitroreducens]RTR06000.1 energy transducer TonB [Halomonas nitroreducens]
MRLPVSLLAGTALTLALFLLLALLVVPPQAEPEPRQELTLALAEVPAEPAPEPVPASAAPPPPPSAPTPPPEPAPAPAVDSAIALPEPELPPMEVPEVPLDESLPELTETPPEPRPEPSPEPEPAPDPAPSPAPASEAAAASPAAPQAASREPVDVGTSAQATRRVPPEYPSRARRRGLQGHVVVQFIIAPDGRVEAGSITVVEADPRGVFDRAARRAIADWRFAEADGRRRARQRLEFQLR